MLHINGLIKTEEQYDQALERSYELMQLTLTEGSPELNELELLGVLIEQYEKVHYPIEPPHPIEAIKFHLDQLGYGELELNKILGSSSRKSDILSGKRKLNLTMIRLLHEKLNISADTLISTY